MTRIAVAVAATLAALTACAQDIPFVPGREPAVPLTNTERTVAERAVTTLAEELGVPKDQVLVDTVRAVQWRDSSLGCPKPGIAYRDVITPGYKVTLRVDRQVHVVHEAGNRTFVCRQDKAMGGITPKLDLSFGPQMVEARKDLAGRIHVPEREILFQSSEGKTWSDASLGCPEPGVQYAQAEVRGWVLTFRHKQRVFTYHTDLTRTIPCPRISAE
jgi:hypothetical protein